MSTIATKKVIHQLEDQFGIQNKKCCTTQRTNLHQIKTGGHIKCMNIFTKLNNLYATNGYISTVPQQIKQANSGVARKTFVDHFQRWHPAANDSVLTGQVPGSRLLNIDVIININITIVYAMEQRINFVL